jgi:xylulokinase
VRSPARPWKASPTALRDSLELLRELGVRAESGRVSGGGARSGLWVRIVAAALDLPLERTECDEGAAFGAALLAGVRAGVFTDAADALARCVRIRDRVEPDLAWAAAYARGYSRFRALYPALRPLEEHDALSRSEPATDSAAPQPRASRPRS